MSKIGDREMERRRAREADYMEEQARQEAAAKLEAERRAHYERLRVRGETKNALPNETNNETNNGETNNQMVDETENQKGAVTGKRGRGRPLLLGRPLTEAERRERARERLRLWRERRRAKGVELGGTSTS